MQQFLCLCSFASANLDSNSRSCARTWSDRCSAILPFVSLAPCCALGTLESCSVRSRVAETLSCFRDGRSCLNPLPTLIQSCLALRSVTGQVLEACAFEVNSGKQLLSFWHRAARCTCLQFTLPVRVGRHGVMVQSAHIRACRVVRD